MNWVEANWLEVFLNLVVAGIGWTCRIWWVAAIARRQEAVMMLDGTLVADVGS